MKNVTSQEQAHAFAAAIVREFLSMSEEHGSAYMLNAMRGFVARADHGGAHARSAGAPTGAALATPHE